MCRRKTRTAVVRSPSSNASEDMKRQKLMSSSDLDGKVWPCDGVLLRDADHRHERVCPGSHLWISACSCLLSAVASTASDFGTREHLLTC